MRSDEPQKTREGCVIRAMGKQSGRRRDLGSALRGLYPQMAQMAQILTTENTEGTERRLWSGECPHEPDEEFPVARFQIPDRRRGSYSKRWVDV